VCETAHSCHSSRHQAVTQARKGVNFVPSLQLGREWNKDGAPEDGAKPMKYPALLLPKFRRPCEGIYRWYDNHNFWEGCRE
jgi:hypothetical protein